MRPSWTRAFGMRRPALAPEAAGGAAALSLPARVGPRARPWWLDVWVRMLTGKPLDPRQQTAIGVRNAPRRVWIDGLQLLRIPALEF